MKDQVKIFRPKKVAIEIFGEKHELHRLTRGDVIDLASLFFEARQGISGLTVGEIKGLVTATGGILSEFMSRSFPTFTEWGELPAVEEMKLFEIIWQENDVPGIIENFTLLGERIKTVQGK